MMKDLLDINDRIMYIIESQCGNNKKKFAETIGFAPQVVSNIVSGRKSKPSYDVINAILSSFVYINAEWLLMGKGEIRKTALTEVKEDPAPYFKKNNVIPLFEDVQTIGGTTSVANTDPVSHPSEWIDAGDWFPGATAAIRHYGDSMPEYPSGCILALREVQDQQLIFWGRNYCIETSEGRVTKKIYDEGDIIMAYSTNKETHSDGRLIDPPFPIPKKKISKIFQVLGYVVKEYSNGPVFI